MSTKERFSDNFIGKVTKAKGKPPLTVEQRLKLAPKEVQDEANQAILNGDANGALAALTSWEQRTFDQS